MRAHLPIQVVAASVWILTLVCSGCQIPPDTPQELHAEVLDDFRSGGGMNREALARQTERYQLVHEWNADGALVSADDFLWASAALVTSDATKDLNLASELALIAAELGDKRGFTVQAEAADKLLVAQARPQRYGTQYIFEPVHQRWKLYPVDPLTSDVERRSVGVPSLAELLQNVEELNEALQKDKDE
ncbi:MAG TPA: hypothetical protein EYQ74_05905 [Planctomycetes bacterium]|nr:hypothetical protein [Planctomycetota bacterium]HIK60250.1 hypothetical protein [Planctomycetota bacterium]